MRRFPALFACLSLLLLCLPASAHIGSKDVFEEVNAGPYKLFVTIRTPNVIPGVAGIEIRSSGATVRSIRVTPTPLTGEAAKHPPTSDALQIATADPAFFTGSLWLMAAGSWQIHFDVDGTAGKATTSVPVPAMRLTVLPMQRSMGVLLALLGVLLIAGIAGMVAAAVGQARTDPGVPANATQRRKGLIAGASAFAFALLLVYGGYKWWNVEATAYAADVYQPLSLSPSLTGDTLSLKMGRKEANDLLPDHGHLMHLYAIRQPEMDAAFHLHPKLVSPGELQMQLPSMPAGKYSLYADIVHANGFPETLSADLVIPPNLTPVALSPEDAVAVPQPLSHGELGTRYPLPDGYSMEWQRPPEISANLPYAFRFQLLNAGGQPASDVRPYLGMGGHAAFVKTDGTVFAHTHPEGSAAMQAMMLANKDSEMMSDSATSSTANLTATVEFPYGFPSAGRYRVFVQMKHANTVETGVFDVAVR